MSQCLRCSKPCETTAVFCDDCRSLLRNEFRQGSSLPASVSANSFSSVKTAPGASLIAQEKTVPQRIVETPRSPGAPVTPHPPVLNTGVDSAEQAVSRLSEAAQLIAKAEPSNRRLPRASRLAPFRDISADIRRESTPLPKLSKMRDGRETQ